MVLKNNVFYAAWRQLFPPMLWTILKCFAENLESSWSSNYKGNHFSKRHEINFVGFFFETLVTALETFWGSSTSMKGWSSLIDIINQNVLLMVLSNDDECLTNVDEPFTERPTYSDISRSYLFLQFLRGSSGVTKGIWPWMLTVSRPNGQWQKSKMRKKFWQTHLQVFFVSLLVLFNWEPNRQWSYGYACSQVIIILWLHNNVPSASCCAFRASNSAWILAL